jgi:hypothetical protein
MRVEPQNGQAAGFSGRVSRILGRIYLSGKPDVLTARAFGALADVESDLLAFSKLVERSLRARRLVKEVLGPVARRDEPKALIADQPLDFPA